MASEFVKAGYPIHLDALLAYANVERNKFDLEDEPTQNMMNELLTDLPVEKYEQDGDWVFKASALMPQGDLEHSSRYITQRMDQVALALNAAAGRVQVGKMKSDQPLKRHSIKIDTARGVFRNQLQYYPVTKVDKLIAYCVGDKDAIEELLVEHGYITHIGAKRRMGHGFISSIDIYEDEAANDLWKLRVKPWQLLESDHAVRAVTKNPYWDKTQSQNAFMPECL